MLNSRYIICKILVNRFRVSKKKRFTQWIFIITIQIIKTYVLI